MSLNLKKTLTRYVALLQEEGRTNVRLDARARKNLAALSGGKMGSTVPTLAAGSLQPRPVFPAPVLEKRTVTAAETIEGDSKKEQLAHLAARAAVCQKCPHLAVFRTQVVFGVGDPEAALMFVGEAPGADEDAQGEPFVGRAGQLLTKMIQAMGLSREKIYIANILKCRPDMPKGAPGNRKPTPDEMRACQPYLLAQIEIIQPRVMVGLGASAVEGLLGPLGPISRLRGRFQEFRGIPFMPTFHPSYLLHNPMNETKRKVWEDLLQVMERLEMPISEKQRGFFLSK